jgi:tRNA modification GTPase
LREAEHEIEEEGIRRSRRIIEEADVVLWLVDTANPATGIQEAHGACLPEERTWYLFNKVDLLEDPGTWNKELGVFPKERCFPLSCKTGEGLEKVEKALAAVLDSSPSGEDVVLLSARHKKEASDAIYGLVKLGGLMVDGQPMELWAEELKMAALAVGRIRGRDLPESAFEEIFEKFCVGQ